VSGEKSFAQGWHLGLIFWRVGWQKLFPRRGCDFNGSDEMTRRRCRPTLSICSPLNHLHFPAWSFHKRLLRLISAWVRPCDSGHYSNSLDPNLALKLQVPDHYRDRRLTRRQYPLPNRSRKTLVVLELPLRRANPPSPQSHARHPQRSQQDAVQVRRLTASEHIIFAFSSHRYFICRPPLSRLAPRRSTPSRQS
jgi:hypothetical protein